ncbi:TIGR03435 family protein [Paludibaculum fermentans]|uniref:TIGR03435 family protein n=1 Tax=Paludibaculum fermentans TaxID=1473598 RepID=A0A7S7NNK6_PALFE|nr:TIGR03435 family protein [Paludibaculum fermentans]QOY86912.1 TIGR03435 family protein [Paludibaculum fermentans]
MTYRTLRVSGRTKMSVLLLLASAAPQLGLAQTLSPLAFSVASVRPNQAGNAGGEGSERETITLTPANLTMRNVSLRSAIRWAYDLRDSQISGPGWLESQRYDISANTPGQTAQAEVRLMLQNLLADRFKLSVRRETKDLSVYAMTVKRSGKLTIASGGANSVLPNGGAIEFHNYSMAELAERLGSRPFRLDRPVVDKTGLEGVFDFSVKFADNASDLKHTLEGMEQGSADGAPSMITILQEQLGLAFKVAKAPVSSLTVEHAEKVPTGN